MPEAHLDDEQLSALLDRDAASDAAEEHVGSCAACRRRFEQLTAAVSLVAAPVEPLPPDLVDRLVGRAVDELEPAAQVLPFAPTGRRRRGPSPAILGAVAAVLVLLLAVPALLGGLGGGSGDDAGMAARLSSDEAAEEADTFDDDGTEAFATDSAAGQAATGGGSAAVAAPANDFATRAAALPAFENEHDLVRHLIGVLSTSEPAEGADETTPEPPSSCEAAAREVGGSRLGGRTYVAPLRWRSLDAEVQVFALTEPIDGAERQAYVMSRPDCRVLAEPRF